MFFSLKKNVVFLLSGCSLLGSSFSASGNNFEMGIKSANGTFTANFYYLYAGDNFDMNSSFRQDFQNSVVRALNTIEQTFVPKDPESVKQSGGINVGIRLNLNSDGNRGAASQPYSNDSISKKTWNESDFGGNFAGKKASINNVEAMLKYGETLPYENGYRQDVSLTFTDIDQSFSYFYAGASPSGIQSHQRDVESLTLHEMGHILGFNVGIEDSQYSALEALIKMEEGAPGFGNKYYFQGETVMDTVGGNGIQLMPGAYGRPDPHIMPNGDYPYTMLPGTDAPLGSTRRTYSDRELDMFKDMGWTLASIPKPSSVLLCAFGLGTLMATRRRQ